MPKRTSAFPPFSLRTTLGDWAIYRVVYVSCGRKRCWNDRHGPYMYARIQTLAGQWRETYVGTLKSRNVQEILTRAARRDPSLEKYLIPDAHHT